ncbi:MAG: hypothetical protein JO134_23435 [Xanthobacteraceae bacterium]|nr:hypothetical protein [Xanthobacteraceae bacterium]
MAKWRVGIFHERLLQLGTVTAPNAHEGLIQAYNLFHIDPEARKRVSITKLEEPKLKGIGNSRAALTGYRSQ